MHRESSGALLLSESATAVALLLLPTVATIARHLFEPRLARTIEPTANMLYELYNNKMFRMNRTVADG
jgi:hypothetical protein